MSLKDRRNPVLSEVLRTINGLSAAHIERQSGVSATTIASWRKGKVRHPQNITLEFALRAAGFKRIIVKDGK